MHNHPTLIPAQNPHLMEAIFHLRTMVFVEEQGVDSALEFDEFEEVAKHWAALIEGKVVACARYRRTRLGFKIERMAVDAAVPVYLHAQVQALPFYTKLGFLPEGDEFEEADIAHYRCLYQGR